MKIERVIFLIIPFLFFTCTSAANQKNTNPQLQAQADSLLIVQHLKTITKTNGYRNYKNISLLNQTAEYIFSVFSQYADTVFYQPYQVEGVTYKNVVCRFVNAHNKPLVVVGAHYDVIGKFWKLLSASEGELRTKTLFKTLNIAHFKLLML